MAYVVTIKRVKNLNSKYMSSFVAGILEDPDASPDLKKAIIKSLEI